MAAEPTFDQFWLNYLRAHARRLTRLLHVVGITIIIAGAAAAVWAGSVWLGVAAVAAGYGTAWAAHLTVEHNEPVLFTNPKRAWWSLLSGLRMYALFLSGRLGSELRRAGVTSRSGGEASSPARAKRR